MTAAPASFEQQYEALRHGCGLVELAGWSSVTLIGRDRQAFLHNFCTNDVKRLVPGASCEAFITSVRGKTIGHGLISCRSEELVFFGAPGQTAAQRDPLSCSARPHSLPRAARYLFLRRSPRPEDDVLVVCNFTPVTRADYHVGVPEGGFWREVLNTDAPGYQGSGVGNGGGVYAPPMETHGRPFTVSLTLPPLGALFLKRQL
jgi:hypothetical protein